MTPTPPPLSDEHWRTRLPSARRTMALYCALFFGGILIGPPIGLICASIHSYLFLEPGLGNPGDASEPWLLFLTWGIAIAVVLIPVWGIIAFIFCTFIWLPLWITQGWHPIFKRPLYATLVGALLAACTFICLFSIIGYAFGTPAPTSAQLSMEDQDIRIGSFIAGGIGGLAITGGLAFFASSRLRRHHALLPSDAINAPRR